MKSSKVILLVLFASQLCASDLTVRLTPPTIKMGAFFSGATVRVEGEAGRDAQVIVIVKGSGATAESFNVKGRMGPIWVNTGKARISGVPSLFLLFSARPVSDFLGAEAIEKYGLDTAALKKQLQIGPKSMDRDLIRSNYLKLKTEEGSYRIVSDAVKIGQANGDSVAYAVEFPWPAKAPPGAYQVDVYECQNGSVTREAHTPLQATIVGFPAWMAALANNHASLYGVVAIAVTMIAGFGMNFLFGLFRGRRLPPAPTPQAAGTPVASQEPTPAGSIPGGGVGRSSRRG